MGDVWWVGLLVGDVWAAGLLGRGGGEGLDWGGRVDNLSGST